MAVTDDAIEQIKAMIVAGELRPGDRLPTEKELGARLGLSRNSLREAVKALEALHVLDVRRGDGTYVTSLDPSAMVETMAFYSELQDTSQVAEVFAVRAALEQEAVSGAIRRGDDEQLGELIAMVADGEKAADVDALLQHDLAFHERIAVLSGNGYLRTLLASVSARTQRARIWRGMTEAGVVQRTVAEHRAIAEAMNRRDVDLARALMAVHVHGVAGWVRQHPPVESVD